MHRPTAKSNIHKRRKMRLRRNPHLNNKYNLDIPVKVID